MPAETLGHPVFELMREKKAVSLGIGLMGKNWG